MKNPGGPITRQICLGFHQSENELGTGILVLELLPTCLAQCGRLTVIRMEHIIGIKCIGSSCVKSSRMKSLTTAAPMNYIKECLHYNL